MSDEALRYNEGKVPMRRIPLSLLTGVARVFEAGAAKYEEGNWLKGGRWSVPYESCLRHLVKMMECGELVDTESGEEHIDHAIANLLILKQSMRVRPDLDDRLKIRDWD